MPPKHPVILVIDGRMVGAWTGFVAAVVAHRAVLVVGVHGAAGAVLDQQYAGAQMWFSVTVAYLVPAVAVTLRLLSRLEWE